MKLSRRLTIARRDSFCESIYRRRNFPRTPEGQKWKGRVVDPSDPIKIMARNALLDAREEFNYSEWQHLKNVVEQCDHETFWILKDIAVESERTDDWVPISELFDCSSGEESKELGFIAATTKTLSEFGLVEINAVDTSQVILLSFRVTQLGRRFATEVLKYL